MCLNQPENEVPNNPQTESDVNSGYYKWEPWESHMDIPDNAVYAGDRTFPMYVARVTYKGDTIVGKLYSPFRQCYFPFGGKELQQDQCEVLTGSGFSWVPYSGGGDALPNNTFSGGRNLNGEQLYIGRAHRYDKVWNRVEPASGAIDDRCKILSIGQGGDEHKYDEFDVLVNVNCETIDR